MMKMQRASLPVPLLLLLLGGALCKAAAASEQAPRVAIIGGGVGGASAAWFFRQLLPGGVHLELFERTRLGGRTQEFAFDGRTFELGASIIHGQNQYVMALAQAMNLTLQSGDDTGAAFSIWDGQRFVFTQAGNPVVDTAAVLARYGVTPVRYKYQAEVMAARFASIYTLQQQGRLFTSPADLLSALDLYDLTQQSAADHLKATLGSGPLRYGAARFAEELAGAVNRINYNQPNTVMNAMAGLVSYLPAAQPDVYSIKEGNAAMPRALIRAADLDGLHLGTTVQAVHLQDDGSGRQRYSLTVQAAGSTESVGPFDAVLLATPLEGSNISIVLDGEPTRHLPARRYQSTITSYVAGELNPSYFQVKTAMPAGDIFVTSSAATPFSVLANKGSIDAAAAVAAAAAAAQAENSGASAEQSGQDGQAGQPQQHVGSGQRPLWKVFSQAPLTPGVLQDVFINATLIITKPWKAYPRFSPPERFAPFLLHQGLCYNNALENAASAMEVAAVAAKNCVLLLRQQLLAAAAMRSGGRNDDGSSAAADGAGSGQAVAAS